MGSFGLKNVIDEVDWIDIVLILCFDRLIVNLTCSFGLIVNILFGF